MAINSRTKGACAEREVANIIFGFCGVRLMRNIAQTQSGGYDLIVQPYESTPISHEFRKLAIECKHHAKVTPALINNWWSQTINQAEQYEKEPILIYRGNREDWTVMLPLHYVRADFGRSNSIRMTIKCSIEVFCAIVREK